MKIGETFIRTFQHNNSGYKCPICEAGLFSWDGRFENFYECGFSERYREHLYGSSFRYEVLSICSPIEVLTIWDII